MCDQGHKVTFDSQKCEIRKEGSGKLVDVDPKIFFRLNMVFYTVTYP
jgi:hypothetical protein